MSGKYILTEAGEAVLEPDIRKWAQWFENSGQRRAVEQTTLPGGTLISTVFLAVDHGFAGGLPVLWETLIFGGPLDGAMDRYTSREDAEAGHKHYVELARQAEQE